MRTLGPLFLILTLLTLTACPRSNRSEFTSADIRGGDRVWSLPGAFVDDMLQEGEAAAGGDIREIVEPDVVRRDGSILYVLNQYRGLTLIDLDRETVLSRVPTLGFPRDLYVRGSRAYVLSAQGGAFVALDAVAGYSVDTRLYVVDIGDPEEAEILAALDLGGDLVDSRLVGDVLYAVGADYQWSWIEDGGGAGAGDPGGVEGSPGRFVKGAGTGGSWITSVQVGDPLNVHIADTLSFGDPGTVIHATSEAVFVASPEWTTGGTVLTYVDIGDPAGTLAVRGSARVPGTVSDRFKLDAWNGVLRVVSNAWEAERRVYVTTFDLANPDAPIQLGQRELESARGDTLFATRFDGDKAYAVTYFLVDPLYVLDLSDPTDPKIAGELEVPGWSTHIEPRGDRLIALGVDDTQGRRVSVSLFDVSDPARPALIKRVSFGDDWAWSTAYEDVKAFTVLDGLLAVPFSGWNDGVGGYDRLQFLTFTPDDLAVRGYVDLRGGARRTLEYGEAHYVVTSEELATLDVSDPDKPRVTHRLALAENVVDYVELSPDVGVEVIAAGDGTTVVRTVGTVSGSARVNVGSVVQALAYGDSAVLVGTAYDSGPAFAPLADGFYKVVVVDCSDPAAPQAGPVRNVDFRPYFNYFPLYYDAVRQDVALPGAFDIAPWWMPGTPQETVFRIGNVLLLRGHSNAYDRTVGGGAAGEGLVGINLDTGAILPKLGLGIPGIVSVSAAGDRLVVSSRVEAGFSAGRPVCAYYVTSVDPLTPQAGPTVNVPGTVVQYDRASDVLVLRDDQWDSGYALDSFLRTVRWDEANAVTVLDDLSLPRGTGAVLGRGARVFLDVYGADYRVYGVAVPDSGQLALGGGATVESFPGSLLDGRGDSAYVATGSNRVTRYVFDGSGTPAESVEVMALPQRVRFGDDTAYLVLGYAGVATLPAP